MKFTYPGLTDQEVEASRARHGSNAVASQEAETFGDKLLVNLKDPISIILIAARAGLRKRDGLEGAWHGLIGTMNHSGQVFEKFT